MEQNWTKTDNIKNFKNDLPQSNTVNVWNEI